MSASGVSSTNNLLKSVRINGKDARWRRSVIVQHQCKPAALARLALEQDPPAKQHGQFLAQVQPQSGLAGPLPLARADLGERLKTVRLVSAPDPDHGAHH